MLGGYVAPSLRVWISADKLREFALTVDDVVASIQREHKEFPAGNIETNEKDIGLRLIGEVSSVQDFSNILISKRGGGPNFRPVRLKDVAKIEDALDDIKRVSRSKGLPAIGMGFTKQRNANAVSVANQIKQRAEILSKNLPKGVTIGINFDSTKFISEAVSELLFTLLLSALLTALVCWAFLGSWWATINVILAIPTSVVGSFMVLKYFNFTLNTFTILGISLAIGIVVDDAIMVLENIVRHGEMGKNKLIASLDGAKEITFAALAATIAIVAIFLPVAFMKGLIGRYFFQFGVTISVAVMFSLLEALTLTPMRCSSFMEHKSRGRWGIWMDHLFDKLSNFYKKTLEVFIHHRKKGLLLSFFFFAASMFMVKFLEKEIVPQEDQGSLFIRMKTPDGSSLQFTDDKMKLVEKILQTHPSVENFYVSIGGSDVNSGMSFVTLKPKKLRGINPQTGNFYSQQDVVFELRPKFKQIKDAKIFVQESSINFLGGRRGTPVDLTLKGPDLEGLVSATNLLIDEMKKTNLFTDLNTDATLGVPEYHIIPDRQKAARSGVSVQDIGKTLSSLMGGVTAGLYSKGGKRYDIRVRLDAKERNQIDDLKKLYVRNAFGELVSLSDLVKVEAGSGPQVITRDNRERSTSITAGLAKGVAQYRALSEAQEIAKKVLPEGYYLANTGSTKSFQESFNSLIFALILGLIISYMVLASQFNSFIQPIIVLLALPFALSGAFVSLYLTHQTLNIYSMIGLILLMGIVKKNSILLVDFSNQMRESGMNSLDAVMKASPVRLRPILMTSFATIAAAVPAAIDFGPGAEGRIPMAIAVIGGVLVSTLLTLYVVPTAYFCLDKVLGLGQDHLSKVS